MKKCLQGRILPSQYLWKILSLHIQEQVAMSHTGSRKKTWMILLVICICQNSSQSSWLQQWNLVQEDVRISSFRNRNKDLASFFDMENKLCYCTNIPGLFMSLGLPHNPSDWCLFIDSSKRSLKGVLLHNGNKYPSIPIAHSVHLKESYDNMEFLLEAIKYSEYQWSLCGDLKVIGLLMGMQAGLTKYCCFLCLWDSRAVSQHYKQKDWGSRSTFVPGKHSLKENSLVDMNKVLLPPLHIKLGLVKNFVKELHKNGTAFQHLCTVFPGLSAAKLLQLLKYAHIFSVYTKLRLFKSQKTRGDRAKLFINLNSAHPN